MKPHWLLVQGKKILGGWGGIPPIFLKKEWVLKNTDWGLGTKKYKHEAGKSIKKEFFIFFVIPQST